MQGMVVREIIFSLFWKGGATGPVHDRGGSHRSLYGMVHAVATWYTKFCIGTLIFNIDNCPLL